MDYKDWIQNRAEELAIERYNKEFHDLPDSIQLEIAERAQADYTDFYSARLDAVYDAWKDSQMMEVNGD